MILNMYVVYSHILDINFVDYANIESNIERHQFHNDIETDADVFYWLSSLHHYCSIISLDSDPRIIIGLICKCLLWNQR